MSSRQHVHANDSAGYSHARPCGPASGQAVGLTKQPEESPGGGLAGLASGS